MQIKAVFGVTMGAALAATTGCMVERSYDPQDFRGLDNDNALGDINVVDDDVDVIEDDIDDVDLSARFTGALNGHMRGDVGPAVDIDQAPDRLTAYDDGFYMVVESVARLDERAAMLYLSVTNGADLFVPGASETFTMNDTYSEDGTYVTLLGCTGQDVDIYDEFDVPADEVDVVVEEGEVPGEVVVQTTGRWSDGSEASATFTLVR